MARSRFKAAGIHVEHAACEGGMRESRPPLVLVHGAFLGAWCWENWLETLPERGWSCYAISLRNHAGSFPVEDEEYCSRTFMADYVADLATVTGQIGRPCVLVGHSLGGLVVQKYLEERFLAGPPETGMILMASAPPGKFTPLRDRALPTDQPFLPRLVTENPLFSALATPQGAGVPPACPAAESPSVMNEYSLPPGIVVEPASIGCPSLVVSAELERTIVPGDDRIARYYGSDYHLAPGIGHLLMLEEGWAHVLDYVTGWLERRLVNR